MGKIKLTLLLVILTAILAACSNNGGDVHLDGAVKGTAHYNAAKHYYLVNTSLKINNTGKQKAANTRFRIQLPSNVTAKGYTYQGKMHKLKDKYITIDVGTIKANQHLSENVKIYLTGSVAKKSTPVDAVTIISGDKTSKANSSIDLSAMKETYNEMDMDIAAHVEKKGGENFLMFGAEGVNQSPFQIKGSDNVYLTISHLPNGISVDTDKLKGKTVISDGRSFSIHMQAVAEEQFNVDEEIPLKGKLPHGTKKQDVDIRMSYLTPDGTLAANGYPNVTTDVYFSAEKQGK